MEGILVFNLSNDLLYQQFNNEMKKRVQDLAIEQGLIENLHTTENIVLNPDVIIQIFSPLITSQKIMMCQFDNSYTSMQCENSLNIVFEEFLGYLFLGISTKPVEFIKRTLGICIAFTKHVCGPNVYMLKQDHSRNTLLTNLINTWNQLYNNDQNILVEAIEQLLVNNEVKTVAINALQAASNTLKQDPHSQRSHTILFVENKFLSLYSSRQAQTLSSANLLFLNIFIQTINATNSETAKKIESHLILLHGATNSSKTACIPHILHLIRLNNGIVLVLLIEYGQINISNGLYEIYFATHRLQNLQMQSDTDNMRPSFDSLHQLMRQTIEALKKSKYNKTEIDESIKNFINRWDVLKKKYLDYFKTLNKSQILLVEANSPNFVESLRELFKLICLECTSLEHGIQRVQDISKMVETKLNEFVEFLQVKSLKNFSLGTYLEEFPGLVHFIHIDRSNGRITAPNLEISDDISLVLKEKVWSMISLSHSYLQKGHMSIMWKDMTFSYSYFLWFEDLNGTSLKPKEIPSNLLNNSIKPVYPPGILSGDYYNRLIEICFPKTSASKVKCYELYCVHLGLVTASCVLEHSRRLAATINDVTGCHGNPIDLL